MREEGGQRVADYLREGVSVDHAIKEVGNAIWKAYARGYITSGDAAKRFEILMEVARNVLEIAGEADLIEGAMEVATESGITLYDALHIARAGRPAGGAAAG